MSGSVAKAWICPSSVCFRFLRPLPLHQDGACLSCPSFRTVVEREDKQKKKKFFSLCGNGIDNVRGGTYCRIDLSDEELRVLTREIRGAKDKCLRCGREPHFASDCYARTNAEDGESIRDAPAKGSVTGKRKDPPLKKEKRTARKQSPGRRKRTKGNGVTEDCCHRCRREGHWAEDCFAKTDIDGRPLNEDAPQSRKPLSSLQNSRETLNRSEKIGDRCHRCGREGHWAEDCYAKADVGGRRLNSPLPRGSPPEKSLNKPGSGSFWDTAFQVLGAFGKALTKQMEKEDYCHRCGRPGHWVVDCYARTNIRGERLD